MIRNVAIAASLAFAVSAGAYLAGRVEGWERREAAQKAADLDQERANQEEFLAQLRASLQEGAASARIDDELDQTLGSIQYELSRLSDGIICPADPDRGMRVDQTISSTNQSISAAGAALNGAAGADTGSAAPRDPNER